MFIRPCYRNIKGKRQPYWALVESYRTERGPRQRTVAWLGKLKESERVGLKRAAEGKNKSLYSQLQLFDHQDKVQSEWVEVDTANVRVENQLEFGGAWLARELIHRLQLDKLLEDVIPQGKEDIGRKPASPTRLFPRQAWRLQASLHRSGGDSGRHPAGL